MAGTIVGFVAGTIVGFVVVNLLHMIQEWVRSGILLNMIRIGGLYRVFCYGQVERGI